MSFSHWKLMMLLSCPENKTRSYYTDDKTGSVKNNNTFLRIEKPFNLSCFDRYITSNIRGGVFSKFMRDILN